MGETSEGAKKCLLCGAQLEGKKEKYCCTEHGIKYRRLINRPHYLKYSRNYMRIYRVKNKIVKYCRYCGHKLPKYKSKFCSDSCRINYYKGVPLDLQKNRGEYGVKEQYIPRYCPECGSDRIRRDGYDIVCRNCGIVIE